MQINTPEENHIYYYMSMRQSITQLQEKKELMEAVFIDMINATMIIVFGLLSLLKKEIRLMGEASTAWIKCRTEDYWAHLFRCVLVFRYTILTNSLSTSWICRILQSFKIDSDTRQQNRLKPKLSHTWNRCLNMKNQFQWLLLLLIIIVIYVTVEKYPTMNPQNSEENTTGMSKIW